MKYHKLGNSHLNVSNIGLGCMGMSAFYGNYAEKDSINTLHYAIDQGVNFLDTADMYGPLTNEQLIAKALDKKRDDVILATKFGIVYDNNAANTAQQRVVNGHPDYVTKSCEGSLKRLNTDVIDLYYLHRIDDSVPIEETIGAMARLVEQGKVRYIGISEALPETIQRAHQTHPLTAVQMEYSLWTRDAEQKILDTCQELDIGFVAYSPLGRGFLSGKINTPDDFDKDDYRRANPRFMGENFFKNIALVNNLKALALQKGCSPAQLALAWVLTSPYHITPIPGSRRITNLQENIAALNICLSPEEYQQLSDFFPLNSAVGARYSDGYSPETMK